MSDQVLAGKRVIDIATLMAGPWIAQRLGDFGADVIKVEQPGIGDHQRRWGSQKHGEPIAWKSIARNKRSVTLDLRKPMGASVLKRLIADADVLIENFRPGTLERWGLGPEVLHEINPGLIIARVSGFGQTGPYREKPGFGTLAEGMSGFSHVTGAADGPPTLPSMPLADGVAGVTGAFAVMLALYHRDANGGGGQVIDIALTESLLPLMEASLLDWDQLGANLRRTGNSLSHVAPRTAYQCSDGEWVALSASAQSIFERLARAIDRPDLLEDPRFTSNNERVLHIEELDSIIGQWMGQHSRPEVLQKMETAEVAVGPIYDLPSVYADSQLQARGAFVAIEDEGLGTMHLVDVVPRLSGTPGRIRSTGPRLGQHNREVFDEMGLTEAEQSELAQESRRVILRTMLFTPANHARHVEKALSGPADAVILDLEDAVAADAKPDARRVLADLLSQRQSSTLGASGPAVFVRVNALTTPFAHADLGVAVTRGVAGILLPKVETGADLAIADWLMCQLESERGLAARSIEIVPIIETAAGVSQINEVAAGSPRVRRLSFGAGDFTLDTNMEWSPGNEGVLWGRIATVVASRAAGLSAPIDTVFADLTDHAGFETEARQGLRLGFAGKLCLHPDQVAIAQRVFTPSEAEVAQARRVLEAFERALASGSASIQLEGKFIDYPIAERARHVIATYEQGLSRELREGAPV